MDRGSGRGAGAGGSARRPCDGSAADGGALERAERESSPWRRRRARAAQSVAAPQRMGRHQERHRTGDQVVRGLSRTQGQRAGRDR